MQRCASLRCFSLFSGIGGFDVAAEKLGLEIIGACAIDRYARSIYKRHFPDVSIHIDATQIKAENLPDFDVLLAGFPCQSFSIAGKRQGFAKNYTKFGVDESGDQIKISDTQRYKCLGNAVSIPVVKYVLEMMA